MRCAAILLRSLRNVVSENWESCNIVTVLTRLSESPLTTGGWQQKLWPVSQSHLGCHGANNSHPDQTREWWVRFRSWVLWEDHNRMRPSVNFFIISIKTGWDKIFLKFNLQQILWVIANCLFYSNKNIRVLLLYKLLLNDTKVIFHFALLICKCNNKWVACSTAGVRTKKHRDHDSLNPCSVVAWLTESGDVTCTSSHSQKSDLLWFQIIQSECQWFED